ncbi:uncharacterized protein LOC108910321 [Anoplophora glabripennis]|uniref:uncharacterized protein LOC108910321 n=1 Tax=Anoplophora glabripennis TaxID=217634 RepID=UPI00087452C3|nr:uncharacterized protein LOC108910321 [Anoplophora glabripennis]
MSNSDTSALVDDTKEVKGSESRGQMNKIEESDEDIPGDFFDDFLKEDFMAGLDIVDDDEWDENKFKIDVEISEKSKNEKANGEKPKNENLKSEKSKNDNTSLGNRQTESAKKRKKDKGSNKKTNADGDKSPPEERRSKQKKKKCEDKKDDDSKHKKSSDKQIDADEFDIRRDPEKTKRDIARDKVRCEKDKEMKIISEKLSLVETGLVPPGMEMEIDIEEIKKQKEKIESKSPRDLRERIKDLKGRNKSPVHKLRSPVRKRSPLRKSPAAAKQLAKKISPLRRRSRSPRKIPLALVRSALSPIRRSPRRSPLRRLSPRRISPLRHRSSDRIFGRRRSRSHSPFYRTRRDRRRDRSSSRESDRERWLKRRNRSRSPKRKRDEKKSFLQEIAEKLNEIRHPISMMPQLQPMPPVQPIMQPLQRTLHYVEAQPLPAPVPAPAPVPPPNSAPLFHNPQQQQQKYDPYDQTFFIGGPPVGALNFPLQSQLSPLPGGSQMPLNPNPMNTSLVMNNSLALTSRQASTPNSMSIPFSSTNVEQVTQHMPVHKLESQEDSAKLFQDKQIRLSEFLAITAKPEVFSSSPTHLQEKIKVITRCHEAIKILESREKKYSGKLVVHKTNKYKVNTGKYLSPLKGSPPVQFPFTDPTISIEDQKNVFTNFVNDLLRKLGMLNDTVVDVDDEETPNVKATKEEAPSRFSPPPPPLITPIKKPVSKDIKNVRYNKIVETNRLCKMVQTDVFKCENCEKRKKILYRSTAMQTSNSSVTFSVSTQVTEEDFQPRIPKTQSLAALTPAQLLAKSRESLNAASRGGRIDIDNFDIHPTGFNRSNFFRAADNYGPPRPNPLFANSSSMYDELDSLMYEGGGRGRDPYAPRPMESNPRFSHNNYY